MLSLPNLQKPCKDCPFRKDTLRGWLGATKMEEILNHKAFVCHKTLNITRLQCAGHMLMLGDSNDFVDLAHRMNIPLSLSGSELIFQTKEECIKHHERNENDQSSRLSRG